MTGRDILASILALATWGALLILSADLRPAAQEDLRRLSEPTETRLAPSSDHSEPVLGLAGAENAPGDRASLPSPVP